MAPLNEDTERRALLAVGGLTVASGAVQVAVPQKLLDALDVEDSPATRQLFGTVGMFMVIVGGLLVGALRRPGAQREVLLGASLQKLGAAGAVAIGVRRSVFSPRALLVAGFDFASGLLALDYLRRLRRS
jgi:hypothetical protein